MLITKLRFVAAGLLATAAVTAAHAQGDPAPSFKGQTVNLYVGSAPGGGFDSYARLVARHLAAFLPGQPSVVVNNKPGASGAVLASFMYNIAPKDGTAFATAHPGSITGPLLKPQPGQLNYKPQEFNYIANPNREVDMCFVRSDAPVIKLQDAMKTQIIVAATADGGSTRDEPVIQNNIIGTRYKVVSGYTGTREVVLALERGEVQGICGFALPSLLTQRPDAISSGFLRILTQDNFNGEKQANAMGAPHTPDFVTTDEDKQVLRVLYAQQEFGRPYYLPPGVSPARVEAYRIAFADMMQASDFLTDAGKVHLDIQPVPAREVQDLVTNIYATPSALVERARQALVYKGP